MDIKLSDFEDNTVLVNKLKSFSNSVENVNKVLKTILNPQIYEKLEAKDKIEYDLFVCYALNTLYWLYLRTKGEDPNNNVVKDQLKRIKDYMLEARKSTTKPSQKIDLPAAKRFIAHGLYKRENNVVDNPPNKKIKFDD